MISCNGKGCALHLAEDCRKDFSIVLVMQSYNDSSLRYIVYYEKCNNVICGRLSRLK